MALWHAHAASHFVDDPHGCMCLQIVAGFIAGVASLSGGKALAADAATPVDLFDDRKKTGKGTGFDLIYEARDLDLSQNERDGISQFKGDLKATKARYQEASKRINGPLGQYLSLIHI